MNKLIDSVFNYIFKKQMNSKLKELKDLSDELQRVVDEIKPTPDVDKNLMDELYEYLESDSVLCAEILFDYEEFDWLEEDLSDFFNVEILKLERGKYKVDGSVLNVPLTGTFCDSQIFTASIYQGLSFDVKKEIYCDDSGTFLFRFSEQEFDAIKVKYGKILDYEYSSRNLPVLSLWKPGTCAYSGIKYLYAMGYDNKERFRNEYAEHLKRVYYRHPESDELVELNLKKLDQLI